MLLKFRSPFKLEDQKENHKSHNNEYGCRGSVAANNKRSNAVGLRILVQISSQQASRESNNYVVVKSALRLLSQHAPPPATSSTRSLALDSCFLKTCHLCNKGLSLDKEVYMYRGDQGFCSIECRDRQIYLDEIKELEASTKKIISSYRSSSCTNNYPSRHRDYQPPRHNKKPISNSNYQRNRPLVIS
ncbi:FCS-Like Zinc finger 17-like [Humulus lupulus]|uniref:FCS-Like Zinc finger 17-like n=1 Tax=Humulus lupulus TaxID=3486 RepID=UPI002B40FEAC|nr:FCS-Like Zinc finger 17-like [Humulus lupulus]